MVNLEILKSGSDIRGTAIALKKEKVNLDAAIVKKIGAAFSVWLAKKYFKKALVISVGHDSRLTSREFADALIAVFTANKISTIDCGLTSTPSMYATTRHEKTNSDGAIMITASHHPYNKNGLKFFTKDGGLASKDIETLIKLTKKEKSFKGKKATHVKIDFATKYYAKELVELAKEKTGLEKPLDGFHIVLDCGNGAGGFFEKSVLKALGADTFGSQFLEPDGNFPNHVPNPEDATAMKSISDCVKMHGADLGIIFDTDVDRAALVDFKGNPINRNALIALLSAILLDEAPSAIAPIIVTDSVTSDGLKKFIASNGGIHIRYKRGYQNVIGHAKKLCAVGKYVPLAIETSGHAALLENDFLDDGAYLVVRVLIKMAQLKKQGKTIFDLIANLEKPASELESRIFFDVRVSDFKSYGETVIKDFAIYSKKRYTLEPSTYEGVRVNIEKYNGWFLLRQSVHDPNMVLNIESMDANGAKQIAKLVYDYLSKFSDLELSTLKVHI